EKTAVTRKLEVDPNAALPPDADPSPKAGEPVPASSAGVQTVGGTASVGGPPPPQGDTGPSGGGGGIKVAAFSAFGVGAVGLGIGTVFILKSISKRNQANDICNLAGGGCPKERKADVDQLDSDASSAQTVAIVGFAVGGASVATGILLLALDKGGSQDAKAARIEPWIGWNSAGVSGRF